MFDKNSSLRGMQRRWSIYSYLNAILDGKGTGLQSILIIDLLKMFPIR